VQIWDDPVQGFASIDNMFALVLLGLASAVSAQDYGDDLSPVLTLCDVNQGDQLYAEVSDGTDYYGFHYDAECVPNSNPDQGYTVSDSCRV
jgi:hypothetical protein